MKPTPKYIIGIDPDLDLSGWACKEFRNRESEWWVGNGWLWDLLPKLLSDRDKTERIIIEAGWLNKRGLSFGGAARARDAGMNHGIGKTIAKFCEVHEIPFQLVAPKTKKWTHEEFVTYTGCRKYRRTNQEQRDAARLIVGL